MTMREGRCKTLTMALGCLLLVATQSALAVRISTAIPAGSPSQSVIQPGESTTFAVDFTNLDATAGTGSAWSFQNLAGLGQRWLIEPIDPVTCGFPTPGEGLRLEFPIELQANETRRCTYTIARGAETYSDGYLRVCLGHQPLPGYACDEPATLIFGTLPDVGVTLTSLGPAEPNSTALIFRIDASNAAAVPTDESSVFTQCRPIGNAEPMAALPFRIETGFPGACPAAAIQGCSIDPPLTHVSWRVTFPSIPAAGNASCLVKVRLRDPAGASINDHLSTWLVYPFFPGHPIPLLHAGAWPGAGQGYDMNPGNNIAAFTVAPLAAPSLPVPTAGWRGWLALAVLLTSAGWLAQRQREIVAVTRRSMR